MKRVLLVSGIGLLGLSAVLLTTGLIQFIIPPTFESATMISVRKTAADTSIQAGEAANTFDAYWLPTEMEKLQSRMVLSQVISNLDLNRKWGEKFKENQLPTDLTYKMLKSQLTVRHHRNTTLVEIRVRNDDPTEAAIVANEIAKAYRDQRISGEMPKAASSLPKIPAVEIIDQAEPNLRPVSPHPLMKILVPAAGVMAGVIGVVLLMLAVMKKDGDKKPPA